MLRTLSGGSALKRPGAARDKGVKSPAGWGEVKPHTVAQRAKLPAVCFLVPGDNKYPICNRSGNFECRGVLAAKKRAVLVASKPGVSSEARSLAAKAARKALKTARQWGCAWSRAGEPQASLDVLNRYMAKKGAAVKKVKKAKKAKKAVKRATKKAK